MPPTATSSGQALANYQTALGSQQSPDAIYNSASSSLGVPAAQQQVSGLRQAITNTTNLLNNVAPSVYGRTGNSLLTNAQANAEIANQSAPIQTKLSGLNTSETNAASDLGNLLTQAGNQSSLKEQGQQDQLTGLKNIYDSLFGQEQATAAQKQQDVVNQQNQEKINSSNANGGLTAAEALSQNQAAQTQATVKSIQSNLQNVAGSDGYVSPQSYAAAASDFVKSGGNVKDFNNYFGYLKNPQNPYYSV